MKQATGRTILAGLVLLAGLGLSGCSTLTGDPGPAICHAADGSLVPVDDDRCPDSVRDALKPGTPPPMSVTQSMDNQDYDASNGLQPGDQGYRNF